MLTEKKSNGSLQNLSSIAGRPLSTDIIIIFPATQGVCYESLGFAPGLDTAILQLEEDLVQIQSVPICIQIFASPRLTAQDERNKDVELQEA